VKVIDRDRQGVQSLASLILENFKHASIRLREAMRILGGGNGAKRRVWVRYGNWDGAGALLNNYLRIDAVGPSRGGENSDCEQ
jgi:hypothetical protein